MTKTNAQRLFAHRLKKNNEVNRLKIDEYQESIQKEHPSGNGLYSRIKCSSDTQMFRLIHVEGSQAGS